MKIGVVADDFTGASDIALTLAEGGMPTVQYVGVPKQAAGPDVQAGVVALKSRTVPVNEAISQSLEACDWLLEQGAEQIIFKVCSTFDSTDAGNIGQVTEALAERLGEDRVVVCPAFPENGRSIYQGHLFVKDQLLSESGMQNHPLTPMTDPDLRRVLARQTQWPVGHIPLSTVMSGVESVAEAITGDQRSMLIADAVRDEDLVILGRALKGRRLMTAGSGLALGLPANFGIEPSDTPWVGSSGAGVVLSGSCSIATREQVANYRLFAPAQELDADEVVAGNYSLQALVEWVLKQEAPPLLFSSADPDVVRAAQAKHGRQAVASAIEDLFANLAAALSQSGVRRIVVAGGETSGAVVSGLGVSGLEIGPRIAAGVPALKVVGQPISLALKSGNFGGPDFFKEALECLGSAT
ncbi:3-oxo-tetronate kinase [Roseibium sp.]|uniref:3-oxo-tetronate kinase n=1 Tax=Roseibium sp. TaxID=1936156 RepID=UPI00326443CD